MDLDPALLSRHVEFARRLARGLVTDPAQADDLAQEALARTLERPPRDPGRLRAYLATVVRRAAVSARRAGGRRRAREEAVARREALASSAELVEAMDLHRAVVRELVRLDEPVRAAVVLRFVEDLPPREIARRLGEPVETVRTRIKRGLATLRARLDAERGGREAWVGALLPLARSGGPPAGAGAGPEGPALVGPGSGLLPALAAGGLGLSALAVGWLVLGGREEGVEAHPEVAALERPVEPLPLAAPDAVERRVEAPPSRAAAPPPEPPGGAGPAAAETGRIVVADPRGEQHAAEDGRVTVVLLGGASEEHTLAVQAGRFPVADLPPGRAFKIEALSLGGRPALARLDRLERTAGVELVVEALWPPPAFLRVVDAATGADLQDVDVLRGVPRYRDDVHPGDHDGAALWRAGVASPIPLEPTRSEEDYWVVAPGHEWGFARVDHRAGGERRVALEPGAAELEVRLAGFEPDLDLYVRLFPPGAEDTFGDLASLHTQEEVVTFRGLPPGAYQVRAELGFWQYRPTRLARTEVELAPGDRARVVLDLAAGGGLPRAVPFAGTLVLPAGFPSEPAPWIRPLEHGAWRRGDIAYGRDLHLERRSPREVAFSMGEVTPGRYVVIEGRYQVWQVVEVGEQGLRDARVVYPELAPVEVQVVDAGSGAPLALGPVSWFGPSPEGSFSWNAAGAEADPGETTIAFYAPLGRIEVCVEWPGYTARHASLEVVRGPNPLRLALSRLAGAWLVLLDGGARVPLDWGTDVEVTPVEGKAGARRERVEGGRTLLTGDVPGRYVVELGPLNGFEPVPPFEVELTAGEPGEHEVRLVRRD